MKIYETFIQKQQKLVSKCFQNYRVEIGIKLLH